MRLHEDHRENYKYAYACAMHRWHWLYAAMSRRHDAVDFRQTVSLACCQEKEKGRPLARIVDREMFKLAMQENWRKDQKGLARGAAGARWLFWQHHERADKKSLELPAPRPFFIECLRVVAKTSMQAANELLEWKRTGGKGKPPKPAIAILIKEMRIDDPPY